MRAIIQRVSRASVSVNGRVVAGIGRGVLALLGVGRDDHETDSDYLAEKVCSLRIFDDSGGKMNLSLADLKLAMLVVPQFTLFGDARRGKRLSFDAAAEPGRARTLYEHFIEAIRARGAQCESGVFQATMQVELVNDGPVTILLDSKKVF